MPAEIPLADLTALLHPGSELQKEEIAAAVDGLFNPVGDEEEKVAFLHALREKGETAGEIAGFAEALLGHAVDPELAPGDAPGPLLDVCGTGGDKLHLFNISTTAMFVLAAGGAAVVKHGNRAITSQCGGADVLEALGIPIEGSPAAFRESVRAHGLGFLFAPAYHPAFRAVAPVRRRLAQEGHPTIFNLLGPLLNPARPPYQLIGLFSRAMLSTYAEALALLGRARAWVVHGSGLDELSTTGPSEVCEVTSAGLHGFQLDPMSVGFSHASVEELLGGDCARNAAILTGILQDEIHGAKRDIVLLNAGAGFLITGLAHDLAAGIELAVEQIDSGRALAKLHALRGLPPGR